MWEYWTSKDRPESKSRRWAIAIAVSLLAQIPILMAIHFVIEYSVTNLEFKPVGVETVAVVEPEEPDKIADSEVSAIEEPDKEQLDEPERPDIVPDGTEDPVGQIVTIVPPETQELPEEARFASRFASKVKEEQKARTPSKEQRVPDQYAREKRERKTPRSRKGSTDSKMRTAQTDGKREARDGVGEEAADEGEKQSGLERGAALDGHALYEPNREGLDPVAKYSPSQAPFASDDYLPDVENEGETTLINSVPYRYAGFFERVKQRVRQRWDPNRPYRLRDPTGEIYGHKDRLTVLRVVLDSRGYVLDTRVTAPSGLRFLDDEARRAMNAASPFVNPPKGLIGEDGKIRFDFGFAFLVATSRHKFFWRLQ